MVSKPKRLYDDTPSDKVVGSAKRKGHKRALNKKPKYQRPVHEIDPKDQLIDDEEIFHD